MKTYLRQGGHSCIHIRSPAPQLAGDTGKEESMLLELCIGCSFVLLVWHFTRGSIVGLRQPRLPPGPSTVPFLGNLHVLPNASAHLRFTEWAKRYGDVYSLKIGPGTTIVLNSARVLHELLHARSGTTSDRPPNHFVDITTGGLSVVLARYTDTWKSMRRVAHDVLTREACMDHLPIQRAEATQLMYDLLEQPQGFYTHVRRYTSSVVLSVVFGLRCPQYKDSLAEEFFRVQRMWAGILEPGALPPLDLIPILRYVPERWASWKGISKEVRRLQRKLYFGLVERCRLRIKSDRRNHCFMEYVLENQEKYNMSDEMIGYTGGVLLEGGSDTTAAFLQWLILCLTAFPEVQNRAHKDIDQIVGSDRSPRIEDFDSLPYIGAIIKEVHRFRPVLPTGIPHAAMADEVVDGYIVPKGSTIIMNVWGIFRDEESYDQPHVFDPDRFLRSEFGTKKGANNIGRRHTIVFGSGRRICPGIQLANNSLILNAMNLLWAFEFKPAKDSLTGIPVPVDVGAMEDGILCTPKPFRCDIRPRSQEHADIIRSDFLEAKPIFRQFELE